MRYKLRLRSCRLQPQVADMRKATHEAKSDHVEATEIQTLKHQLALLQSQVAPPQAQSHQIPSPAYSKDFSFRDQHQSPSKRIGGQSSSRPTANSRPRPWYCFRCGKDAHLASTVEVNQIPFWLRKRDSCLERNNGSGISRMTILASSS